MIIGSRVSCPYDSWRSDDSFVSLVLSFLEHEAGIFALVATGDDGRASQISVQIQASYDRDHLEVIGKAVLSLRNDGHLHPFLTETH